MVMAAHRKVAGTWKSLRVWRKVAGVWKECNTFRKVAGVWKQISSTFAASIPSVIYWNGTTGTIDTPAQTCTVTGGTPAYTYSWVFISGDIITAVTPTGSSTVFRATLMASPEFRSAVFNCTVTDSLSQVIDSNTIDVQIERT